MSKEASKKRREAEARLIADLLAALPAFEMPRRSQHNSSSSSANNNNNNLTPTKKSGSQIFYEDIIANGVNNMALSISATLPTLRYAAVFARKQALLSQLLNFVNFYKGTGGMIKPEKMEPMSPLLSGGGENGSNSLIHRSELPGLLVVFDPTKRIYPISNGTPLEVSGEMVYVSENVMTYLGHSVQDILSRADSVYDLLLPEERPKIMEIVNRMLLDHEKGERSFLCRFSNALFTRRVRTMSSDYKLMLVKARLLMSSSPLVVFSCCPVLTPLYQRDIDFLIHEPGVFTFKCSPQLIITRVDNRAGQFLAFEDETELLGRRWLNLIHPDDLMSVVEQLRGVLGPNKRDDAATMFVVRMMRAGDELAPTKCIYVSVVLAYRHFGGASLNGQQPPANNNSQPSPATPNGVDKMDDDAFSEACQPSVTITCQVLPDNNMEIVNEIKRYANPLFNCHGLSRPSGNATENENSSAINNTHPVNTNNAGNASSSTHANNAGHYRRYNSHTGTHSHNQHVRRQILHRMSFRSSITSCDGLYDPNVDSASVVTAPAMTALLSRRLGPMRRSSAASMPGFAAQITDRMHSSTSDYALFMAQQQQQQTQPAMKRQRTSELLYATDDQQSPMSAVSFGQVATPPSYQNNNNSNSNDVSASLPVQPPSPWSTYRQQHWEQMSDCSAPTGGYQRHPPALSLQPLPAANTSYSTYPSTASATTPIETSPAPVFTPGLARGVRTSQPHMFSKNAAMSTSGSHYQRRSTSIQHQANSIPNQLGGQLYGTSPSSVHSLNFIDQQYGTASNHSNNATVISSSNAAKSSSFFFPPNAPGEWAPVRRDSLNFQSLAPDVLFATHHQQIAQQSAFFNQTNRFPQEANHAAMQTGEDADFLYQAVGAPSADFSYNQQTAPCVSYMASSVTDDQDQWPGPHQNFCHQPPVAFPPSAVSVTQQIHERIARKASVKKVTEWLGYNFDASAAVVTADNGASSSSFLQGTTGADSLTYNNSSSNCATHSGAMILPEIQADELSNFLDREAIAAAGIIEPEPEWPVTAAITSTNHVVGLEMMPSVNNNNMIVGDCCGEDDSGFSVGHYSAADDSPLSGAGAAGHHQMNAHHQRQRQLSSGHSTATSNLNNNSNPTTANNNNNNNNIDNNMVFAM